MICLIQLASNVALTILPNLCPVVTFIIILAHSMHDKGFRAFNLLTLGCVESFGFD